MTLPTPTSPTTFTDQELAYAKIILESRGWRIDDARQDGDRLSIIASKEITTAPLTMQKVDR